MRGTPRVDGVSAALRVLFVALAFLLPVLGVSSAALAKEVPPLQGHVNDTAGLLSAAQRARLEQRLTEYERKTGQQFALLTVDTLDGDSIEDFSIRTVEAWKLGKKGKDDGLLMLIARDDRKFRIEVGYGLEGDVTDVIAARIQREVLTPAFRRGDFAGGIDAAFERLMRIASGQSVPESQEPALPAPERRRSSPGSAIGLFLFFFFFVLPLFGRIFGGSRRRRGGFGTHALGAALGGLSGLSHRGGGSWGGGGFGGGGFRGGGGGFGGGGASGSW